MASKPRNRTFDRMADTTHGEHAGLRKNMGYDKPQRFYFPTDPDWYQTIVQVRLMRKVGTLTRDEALAMIKDAVLNHPEPKRQEILRAFSHAKCMQPIEEWM